VTAGVRGAVSGFDADASLTYGRNAFSFGVDSSLNPSLGPSSPRSFDSGAYIFDQLSANIDMVRDIQTGLTAAPVTVAFGVEYRRETYETQAGQPESYSAGPFDLAIGAQAAPGLTPGDEVDIDRDVWSAYLDVSTTVGDRLFLNAAGRFEDYSDFGQAWTGKASGLYEITPSLNLRAALSNSVRAPGLQQVGFSDTTLNFGAGRTLVRTRTLRVDDPIARALGALDLEPEESVNVTAGLTGEPIPGLRVSVDVFQIDVSDRITLSDRFFGSALEAFVQAQPGGADIQSVRFFTNAIDTQTRGVDVVAAYAFEAWRGEVDLSVAYSRAKTEISGFAPTPAALRAIDPGFALVGVEEINTIETAAPTQKLVASARWSNERFSLGGRASYFGEATRVFNFGGGFEPSQTYGSEIQLDLEGSFSVTDALTLTVGAVNLLDEYPDLSSSDINYFGNLPYDVLSPVGVNGRYVYGALRLAF
jgi:iron complex outermembrane receptor protein